MTMTKAIGIWGLLVALTLAAWAAAELGYSGRWLALALFASVFIKGHLVIADFMALRRAPRLWRSLLHGWLLIVSALILLAYSMA